MVVVDSMQVCTAVAGRVVDSRVAGRAVDSRVVGMVSGTLDMAYTLVVSRVGEMDQAWLMVDWFVFPVYLFQWMLGIEFC